MDNKVTGFIVVVGAGLSTSLGAAVVFQANLVRMASKKMLAGSLGLSAGVMLYVSFVEIFQKAVQSFSESVGSEPYGYLYATLCFFGGIVLIRLIEILVHWLDGNHMHLHHLDVEKIGAQLEDSELSGLLPTPDSGGQPTPEEKLNDNHDDDSGAAGKGVEDITVTREEGGSGGVALISIETPSPDSNAELERRKKCHDENEKGKLLRMGLFTALAIAIHNFPEGLATFVATVDDPAVGVPLGVAIAIHNIPEGLCVAVPIYFATGNRSKAFVWGVLSGLSEILAAGLGWIILASVVDDIVYGILFGLVAGMMVAICMYELIPTARGYDPNDKITTTLTVTGMIIMAISLIVFKF